jgi:hypothetical protein
MRKRPIYFMLSILTATTFIGCRKENCDVTRTYYGAEVPLGNDNARSFVTIQPYGQPISIGIELGESALDNLPANTKSENSFELPLPAQAKAIGVDHIEIDWNPFGHPPEAIYGLPHFDFHFYYISKEEQSSVIPGPDTVTVPAKYVPKDYVNGVVAVPDMGVHWTDSTSSEYHGLPFTTTFIYGFYHGEMTFVEPMVTKAFLESHPDFFAFIKQPVSFQHHNFYPTSYKVQYDASKHVYLVNLTGLKKH